MQSATDIKSESRGLSAEPSPLHTTIASTTNNGSSNSNRNHTHTHTHTHNHNHSSSSSSRCGSCGSTVAASLPLPGPSPHSDLISHPQTTSDPSVSQPLPHGYNNVETPTSTVPPIIDPELAIHPTLRSPGYMPTANMMPSGVPPPEHPVPVPHTIPSVPAPAGDPSADGRKAKRELSQSKRAAQNRAAQRAFRERKEGYIKKLEQQVRDFADMEQNFRSIQSENYSLKEYIVHLQSRLLAAQVEPPQPPPNVNLTDTSAHNLPTQPAQEGPSQPVPSPNTVSTTASSSLDAVAQAVQSLSRSEASFKHEVTAVESQAAEDARTVEEIQRQLQQAEAVPAASM